MSDIELSQCDKTSPCEQSCSTIQRLPQTFGDGSAIGLRFVDRRARAKRRNDGFPHKVRSTGLVRPLLSSAARNSLTPSNTATPILRHTKPAPTPYPRLLFSLRLSLGDSGNNFRGPLPCLIKTYSDTRTKPLRGTTQQCGTQLYFLYRQTSTATGSYLSCAMRVRRCQVEPPESSANESNPATTSQTACHSASYQWTHSVPHGKACGAFYGLTCSSTISAGTANPWSIWMDSAFG